MCLNIFKVSIICGIREIDTLYKYTFTYESHICLQELPQEVLEEKTEMIRKLQTQLRNEEMALVLLKKIRQSQLLAEAAKAAEVAKAAAKEKAAMMASGGQHAKDYQSSSSRHHHSNQQSHGSHHSSSSSAQHYPNHSGNHSSKVSGHGSRSSHNASSSSGSGNKMTVGQQLNQSRQQQALQQQLLAAVSGGGKNALVPDLSQLKPVNLQDPKNLPPGLPADLVKLMNKTTGLAATNATSKLPNDQQPQRPPSKPQPKVDHETPAQKQAAAKLALRQQLEKTLLQVIYLICNVFELFELLYFMHI